MYADKYKKDEKLADKPIDADANGVYCIALKGLYEILQIKNNWKEGEVFSRDTLIITNADWFDLCRKAEALNNGRFNFNYTIK